MDICEELEAVFKILSLIYVHDVDVDHMAQAKQILRNIYAKLSENEGSETDGR